MVTLVKNFYRDLFRPLMTLAVALSVALFVTACSTVSLQPHSKPSPTAPASQAPQTAPGASAPTSLTPIPGTEQKITTAPLPNSINAEDLEKIDAVLNLTRDLLLLAPDVARVSWNNKVNVDELSEDPAQLKNISQAAALYKADTTFITEYFQGLIKADRYVQSELHKQWRAQGVPATMTLTRTQTQLQNVSAELLPKLLAALAALPPVLEKKGAANSVRHRALEFLPNRSALSEATREMAIAPLLKRGR